MAPRARGRARGEAGVTLVELMIALLVQSIFVVFVMGLYGQLSGAYRGQSQVAELQMTVQAARETILPEVSQAGFGVPDGFFIRGDNVNPLPPLSVVNNAEPGGTDLIRFYYADASAQARVTDFADPTRQSLTVDFVDTFAVGDVAVIVKPRLVSPPPGTGGTADIAQYRACVVRITAVTPGLNQLAFAVSEPTFNQAPDNNQCYDVQADIQSDPDGGGMIYRFVGRSYRIDPARKDLSVLQMSPSGELIANDWVDMGIGFTDLQIASRWYEQSDVQDLDGDLDPERDWYSGEAQETPDLTATRPPSAVITQVSISFAARTSTEVSGVASGEAPGFIGPNVNNNRLGDRPPFTLLGVPDASRPLELRGNHIYRFTTSSVDIRNLGVGR